MEKRQNFSQNELKQIAKMQNLSSNDIKQITKMKNQLQDELEKIAKKRRIENDEKISREGLIIALLKSKRSVAELFNNNFDNGRIKEIEKIPNELTLPKNVERKLRKSFIE